MVADDWTDLKAIHSRLDSTIMFTLIRFTFSIFKVYINNWEIAFVCLVAIMLTTSARRYIADAHGSLLFEVIDSLSSAVLSQSVINIATHDSRLMKYKVTQSQQLIMEFTTVTALLLMVTVIPDSTRKLSYVDRSITLLLYMYTDATQYIIQQLNVSRSAGVLCVVMYMFLIRYEHALSRRRTLQYVIKAVSMVSINILLESVSTASGSVNDQHTRAFLLIVTLFIIDALNRVSHNLEEGRNFALWKGALQIFNMYKDIDIDSSVTLFAAVIVIIAKHALQVRNSTLVELYMLITVNVILSNVSVVTNTTFNLDSVLILFVIVLAIHGINHVIHNT